MTNPLNKEGVKHIFLKGEVLEGQTLAELKKQAGDLKDIKTLLLEIASPGGNVAEGLAIMMWLDELSSQGKEIATLVSANAYSIASLIMLAADLRLISKHAKVMVHNPMIPELKYVNANQLEEHMGSLRELENLMYEIYQAFTNIEPKLIKALMDQETYLDPWEAVRLNFAHTVVDIDPKPYEMATNIKKEVNMSKTLNILNKVISVINKSEIVNQLYYSEKGEEVEIYQKDMASYKKGDRTNVEEGTVKLSDGASLTIKDYVIEDISKEVPTEEEKPEEAPEEVSAEETTEEAPKEEEAPAKEEPSEPIIESPKEEKSKDAMPGKVVEKTESTITTKETIAGQITRVSSWEESVINDSFEIGDVVEYKPENDEDEPRHVSAGEWELEDGSRILTDSKGAIRFKWNPKAEEEQAPEPEAKEGTEEETAPEAFNEGPAPEVEEMFKGLENRIKTLEKEQANTLKKFENASKFEALATKAIDQIASNVSSSFKPDARAAAEIVSGGSIFKRLKEERGL